MSQPVLLKVYGNITPAGESLREVLAELAGSACPAENARVELDGETLLISFEGVYFPADESLALIAAALEAESEGKLDILDIENWRLVRNVFKNGVVDSRIAPLNNVLDYSGH